VGSKDEKVRTVDDVEELEPYVLGGMDGQRCQCNKMCVWNSRRALPSCEWKMLVSVIEDVDLSQWGPDVDVRW